MKATKLFFSVLAFSFLTHHALAGKEVDRLLADYSKIETVSCQIRRTKAGSAGKVRFLSRVYYTNKGQLHAEGITPLKRHTIADGKRLYQYTQGAPKGFSRPIEKLSEAMQISLRMVPGTAMDHLLRMKGCKETELPGTADAARRVEVDTQGTRAILLFDAQQRLTGIDFYDKIDPAKLAVQARYRSFNEVLPGVWVPFAHEMTSHQANGEFKEAVRVDRFVANQPIAQSLFIPSNFFDKDIDFVDEFSKIQVTNP